MVNSVGKGRVFTINPSVAGLAARMKSLGTVDEVADVSKFYGRACDMDWMFRVAPRVYYRKGSLQLAGEVEISTASFGTLVPNTCGDIINTNARVM